MQCLLIHILISMLYREDFNPLLTTSSFKLVPFSKVASFLFFVSDLNSISRIIRMKCTYEAVKLISKNEILKLILWGPEVIKKCIYHFENYYHRNWKMETLSYSWLQLVDIDIFFRYIHLSIKQTFIEERFIL